MDFKLEKQYFIHLWETYLNDLFPWIIFCICFIGKFIENPKKTIYVIEPKKVEKLEYNLKEIVFQEIIDEMEPEKREKFLNKIKENPKT